MNRLDHRRMKSHSAKTERANDTRQSNSEKEKTEHLRDDSIFLR